VYGSDSVSIGKRTGVANMMRVVLHYRVNGILRDWVCTYDRLDHIINVCIEKGFDIVGVFRLQNGMRIVFSEDISKGCVFADDAFEKLDKAIKILNEVFYDLVDPEEEEND
jgi:hypothetical protein